ncbi:MAG: hypothetical protein LC798_01500 [Chloroflexi bacterium]|nr:hypothetical protein [Chloroflexota bacterium]
MDHSLTLWSPLGLRRDGLRRELTLPLAAGAVEGIPVDVGLRLGPLGILDPLGPVGQLDLVVGAGLGFDGLLLGVAVGVIGFGGEEPVAERSQREDADGSEDERDRREADAEQQSGDRAGDRPGDAGTTGVGILEGAPDDLHEKPGHAGGEEDERCCKGIHRRMSCGWWVVPPVIANSPRA